MKTELLDKDARRENHVTCWSFQEPYTLDVPDVSAFAPTTYFGNAR